MQKGAFGYARGGAENEQALRKNTASFDKKYIESHILTGIDLKDLDLTTQLFGIPLSMPIIQAPMAAHGLAHVDGELATTRGMLKAGSIPVLSTYGNKTIEGRCSSGQRQAVFLSAIHEQKRRLQPLYG